MSDTPKCEPPDDLAKVDGWHWVQLPFVAVATPIAWMVNPANLEREWRLPSSSAFVSGESKTASTWRYLCPVLAPAEADALRAEVARLNIEREVGFQEARSLRARVAVLEEALKKIAGGFVPGAGNLAISENWHGFAQALQAVARTALSTRSET